MRREELAILRRIPRRSALLLYLAATSSDAWLTLTELGELAGVRGVDRVRVELQALVAQGWLSRELRGGLVRFRTRVSPIGADRKSDRGRSADPIGADRTTPHTHARASGSGSGSETVRSARPEGYGEGGRAVLRIAERWGVTPAVARVQLGKLLAQGLQEREALAYLDAAELGRHPAFDGLHNDPAVRFKLGTATTPRRVAVWLASRQVSSRAPRDETPRGGPVETHASTAELEAFAATLRRAQ